MGEHHQVFGSIIRLKPEYTERYKALHRHTFPGVLDRISKSHISDYTIFLADGILFSHMIYEGQDFISDMREMGDEVTRDWWLLTDPMQEPMAGRIEGEWWATLKKVMDFRQGDDHASSSIRMAFLTGVDEVDAEVIENLSETLMQHELPVNFNLKIFSGFKNYFIYLELPQQFVSNPAAHLPVIAQLLAPARPMEEVFHTGQRDLSVQNRKKAFVTGCFDMLHSGHVAFLAEASGYGELYVGIGSDANVAQLKNRFPINGEAERKYMLESLACVSGCLVNTGWGIMDFETELDQVRPDIFIVNEEGHSPEKENLCRLSGIEYRVLKRVPFSMLPPRSTTNLRSVCTIPFRIDLAGGWLDQPYVSEHCPGSVLTISIEPSSGFNERSGMASSTRRKAIELWYSAIPHGDAEHLAKILFGLENPPGTKIIAGSQDALGIVLPGLNNLHYSGSYWPDKITSVHEEDILSWLEQHLYLVTLGPRISQYDVLAGTDINPVKANTLARAADDCWNSILAKDLAGFGNAFRRSFEAQVSMFPNMAHNEIYDIIGQYSGKAAGWKLSGAGGGGYLILVSEQPVDGAIQIRIRRKNNL